MSDDTPETEVELIPDAVTDDVDVNVNPTEADSDPDSDEGINQEAEALTEADVPVPPTPPREKQRRLSGAQWAQVVVLWELGKVTVLELSAMFGITEQAIRAGLKSRGAKKGCRAHEIGEQIVVAQKSIAQQQIEKIASLKEKYLSYNDLITKLTLKEISEAAKAGVPLATRRENLTALQKAASIIARNRHENYHLLGLYDQDTQDEELPDIGITEYSPEELEQIQRGFETVKDEVDEFAEPDLDLPFGEDEIVK